MSRFFPCLLVLLLGCVESSIELYGDDSGTPRVDARVDTDEGDTDEGDVVMPEVDVDDPDTPVCALPALCCDGTDAPEFDPDTCEVYCADGSEPGDCEFDCKLELRTCDGESEYVGITEGETSCEPGSECMCESVDLPDDAILEQIDGVCTFYDQTCMADDVCALVWDDECNPFPVLKVAGVSEITDCDVSGHEAVCNDGVCAVLVAD